METDIYWNPSIGRISMHLNKSDAALVLQCLELESLMQDIDPDADVEGLTKMVEQLKTAVAFAK